MKSARNLKNTVWNVLDTVMYPVAFLGITPFFLHHLGDKMFGIYMLGFSVLFSLQILNMGLGTATQRNVARFFRNSDTTRLNETINTNLSLAFALMLASIAIGTIIALLVVYADLFNIEQEFKNYTAVCLLLASTIGGLKFCEQIVQNTYKGFERFDVSAAFNITVRMGILLVNFGMVWAGYKVISMFLVNLFITGTVFLIQLAFIKKVFPDFRARIEYNTGRIKEELNFGIWIWLQSITMIITYQADRYAVTYLGLNKLSYYALTATIFNHIYMMLGSLVPWFFPRIAGMSERKENVLPLYKTMRGAVAGFGILSLACFYLLRQPILTLWVGPEKFRKLDDFLPLFTGFEMFFILTIVPSSFLNAAGLEKLLFYINLLLGVFTVAAIVLCYLFVHSAQSVAFALLIGAAISLPVMQFLIYRATDKKHFFQEVVLSFLAPLTGLMLIFCTSALQQLGCVVLMLFALKFTYFSKDNFDIKWLKH